MSRDTGVVENAIRHRIRELVALAEYGPFLRKRQQPVAAVGSGSTVQLELSVENVLHDPVLLVISLLNQERIVLDSLGKRLRLVRTCGQRHAQKNCRKDDS